MQLNTLTAKKRRVPLRNLRVLIFYAVNCLNRDLGEFVGSMG
jgi:hypothetical protein